ncbi:MAG: iron-containing redox enzyme family protein [Tatlockia sp.]|nr:iron-containing redox enzyme family protein [Tatlockia sp.]
MHNHMGLNTLSSELGKPIDSITFEEFITNWDLAYEREIQHIKLFNEQYNCTLSEKQKAYFVKAFYHIRGHFHDFLWFMGNIAPDIQIKEIIINNIAEEFGGNYGSHEKLYYLFAESMNIDIQEEIENETTYEHYIAQFNKGHLNWLRKHEWLSCLAAFAAYEHLDNIDYRTLSLLARNIGTSSRGLTFFKVHEKVSHFSALSDLLENAWLENSEKIKKGFNFIGSHQLRMWNQLSDRVFCDEFMEVDSNPSEQKQTQAICC